MSRSSTLPCLTLLFLFVLCPPAWGEQENQKAKKINLKNTVKVHSVTLLENKTGRICFAIHVKNPNCDVEINLDNVTDLGMLKKKGVELRDCKNQEMQFSFCLEGKKLKITLPKGKYYLSYVDTTITYTAPVYKIQFENNTAGLKAKLSSQLWIKNTTSYDWLKDSTIEVQMLDNQCCQRLTLEYSIPIQCESNLILAKTELNTKDSLQYVVDLSEFSDRKNTVYPQVFLNVSKTWPKEKVCFQTPGTLRILYPYCHWEKTIDATEFQEVTQNKALPLFVYTDALLTRTMINTPVLKLNEANKSIAIILSSTKYMFSNSSTNEIINLIRNSKKIAAIKPNLPQLLEVETILSNVSLLIDTQTTVGEVSSIFASLSKKLEKILEPITIQSDRLQYLKDTTDRFSRLLKDIPKDISYRKSLFDLASTGNHDADVTLLRKQRKEQTALAQRFIQIYNALVLDKVDVYPIQIESPITEELAGSNFKPGSIIATRIMAAAPRAPAPPPAPPKK